MCLTDDRSHNRAGIWQKLPRLAMQALIDLTDPDKLHLSDWATRYVSEALFGQISKTVTAAAKTS